MFDHEATLEIWRSGSYWMAFNLNPGVDRTEIGRLERLSTITSSSAARGDGVM
jgi:hypothetical protein